VRFFLTDLDKTFLRSDLSLSDFSKRVWNSFEAPLSIATARSLKGATTLLQGLKLNYPMILLDGAMIATKDEIIKINAIDEELGNAIIEKIEKELHTLPLIVGLDQENKERFLYPAKLNIHQKMLLQKYKNDSRILNLQNLRALPNNLKIVYLGDEKEMRELEKLVQENFQVETKLSQDPYQPSWFLTILHPLGDKAHALAELENILGVDAKDVTVFGDSHNDIGMFQKSGRAIAVKNALPEVKEHAHIVLPHTNDEDAVARYLAAL
jgi:Cof subfamily protein (haloacid dehalogenase superfamily)